MKILSLDDLNIYQFKFYPIESNMFLICKGNNAIIVDPHYSIKALDILEVEKIKEVTILLTHEHPDHTSGVNYYKTKYNATLICSEMCAEKILKKRNNAPLVILMQLMEIDKQKGTNYTQAYKENNPPYSCVADITFQKTKEVEWHDCSLLLTSVPGHSPGSITIELNNKLLFSGDYLIKNTPVITRFKDSSVDDLENITIPYFESLNEDLIILAGHGEIYSFKEIEANPLDWLRI